VIGTYTGLNAFLGGDMDRMYAYRMEHDMESRSGLHEYGKRHCGAGVMLTRRLIANDKCDLLTGVDSITKCASCVSEKTSQ
jgi:hypothetical protein